MKAIFLLLVSVSSGTAFSEENKLSEKSPFLPPGHGEETIDAPVAPPTQGPLSRELEFRGIIQIGDVFQFSLFSKKDNKGYWIKENETVSGISVRNFNADNGTVIASKNGRSEQLTLVSATDNPLPVTFSATAANQPRASQPNQPNQIKKPDEGNRRVVPRRRVILPKSN